MDRNSSGLIILTYFATSPFFSSSFSFSSSSFDDELPPSPTQIWTLLRRINTLTGYKSGTWLNILYGPQLARVCDEYISNDCCQRRTRDYSAHHMSLFDRYDRYISRDIEDIFDVRMPFMRATRAVHTVLDGHHGLTN